MSINFKKKKNRQDSNIKGVRMPNTFRNSKPIFKKKKLSDPTFNQQDMYSQYKVCIPFEIDQRHFLSNEKDVKITFEIYKNSLLGHIDDKFSSKQINKILKTNISDLQDEKAKKILKEIKKEVDAISVSSINKSQKDAAIYKYFYNQHVNNSLQIKHLASSANKNKVSKKIRLPIDDLIRYDKIGESKGNLGKSDKELFGTKNIYTLHQLSKNKKNEEESIDLPTKISGIYEKIRQDDISYGPGLAVNVLEMYKLGRDPSEVFEGEESHMSLPSKLSGTGSSFSNKNIHAKTTTADIETTRQSQIIHEVLLKNLRYVKHSQGTTDTYDYTSDTNQKNSDINLIESSKSRLRQVGVKSSKVSKRYRVVYLELDVASKDINANGNVSCYLRKYDNKGLEIANKRFIVNIRHHFQKFILSQFDIESIDVNIINDNQNKMRVNIKNLNNLDLQIKLYKVDVNSNVLGIRNYSTKQKHIKTFNIEKMSNESFVFENLENGSSVLRMQCNIVVLGQFINYNAFKSFPITASNILG
jgi:hypothetical protein